MEEQRAFYERLDAMAVYDQGETPAGPAPYGDFQARITHRVGDQTVIKHFEWAVPYHLASSIYMVPPANASADPGQRMSIVFQPTLDAPHIAIDANPEDVQRKMSVLFPHLADFQLQDITRIEITPSAVPTIALPPKKVDDTKPGEPGKPTDPIDTAKVLEMISSIIGIGGAVSEQVKKRRKKSAEASAAVAPVPVVGKSDIEKLDEDSKRLIITLGDSVQRNFKIWNTVWPKRDQSADPIVNARVEVQLDELQDTFCADFTNLQKVAEKMGRRLEGFEAVRVVCDTL